MNNHLRSLPAFFAIATLLACVAHSGEAETIPAEFQGAWTINKSGIQPSGEQPLRVSGREITAHETYGQVVRAVLSGKDNRVCLVTVNAACEGMEGREKLKLILSADGRQLTLEQEAANTCAFGSGVYYRVR